VTDFQEDGTSGAIRDVRIKGEIRGLPEELVGFLYAVENFPYLLRVVDWRLEAVAPGVSGAALVPLTSPAPKEQVSPSQLLFTLVVTVRYE